MAAARQEAGQPGAQIDLTRLSIEQLQEVRKQLDAELDHLATSFAQLRSARGKFQGCAESVMESFQVDGEGKRQVSVKAVKKEVLVPLTSSLYVPGEEEEAQVTVDIGTGYYLSKSPAEALAFYKDKRQALDRNLQELESIIGSKAQNLKVVTEVYAEKMRQAQQRPQSEQ
ncbi:c-myc binding protein [Protomyces lactucae-debilis]|uniref:C-myc binding protein n=1 Tax=Protomyces lactucae-debilis TaxID=2754530 RepID=A0A1Y2EV32_PROLT|nr:c-myc binding protein [Protomyces lactucae-debilis]ORY75430.1 c-myc binding protein [Protomyces lactucae-debilis]